MAGAYLAISCITSAMTQHAGSEFHYLCRRLFVFILAGFSTGHQSARELGQTRPGVTLIASFSVITTSRRPKGRVDSRDVISSCR